MTKAKYDLVTDVAIIGAGPAGCSASIFLSKQGIKHIIFDKAVFPRDKICGDGLSGKVVSVLKQIDEDLVHDILKKKESFQESWGVRFIAPNGKGVNIPFKQDMSNEPHPPGFTVKRFDFDHFLIKQLDPAAACIKFGTKVIDLKYAGQGIELHFTNGKTENTCLAKVVIGAEGDRSILAKKIAGLKMNPKHYFAGLRAYYENVTGMHEQSFIELYFLKEVLPGYLWIFPLPNNQANVGIGMLTKDLKDKHINLKKIMLKAIEENPFIKDRFKNAKLIDNIKGWGLPLGSIRRKISGERFLLTGDAASLIDPFTGEGIGNAMLSGKFAAQTVKEAIDANDFSKSFLSRYDEAVFQRLWDELKLSYKIQRLVKYPWLFNFVVNRIHKNKTLQEVFSNMFSNLDMRAKLRSPAFYLKLLINGKP